MTHVYVVAGRSMFEGAKHAQARIRELHGDQSSVIAIELLGPVLLRSSNAPRSVGGPEEVAAPGSDNTAVASAPARRPRRGTRTDQLLELLHQHEGQAHLRDIATAFDISVANAQNIVVAAVKKGVVERVGKRTGLVALSGAQVRPSSPVAPGTEAERPTQPPSTGPRVDGRAAQVAEVVRRRGGEVHVTDIAQELQTNTANARTCIASAVRKRLVERVGRRTGRVRLLRPQATEHRERPSKPVESTRPEALEGLQRRVYRALVKLEAPATAKQIAGVLGCRPREAGNAATVLVGKGLAVRHQDEGRPRYSVL